ELLALALAAAREAVRIKGEFVANTSHELRTPLNAILNVPEALLERFSWRASFECQTCHNVFDPEPGDKPEEAEACPECHTQGSLRIIEEPVLPGDARPFHMGISQIARSAKNLLRVVEDLLDFSKLEAGRMRIQAESISVSRLLDEARLE